MKNSIFTLFVLFGLNQLGTAQCTNFNVSVTHSYLQTCQDSAVLSLAGAFPMNLTISWNNGVNSPGTVTTSNNSYTYVGLCREAYRVIVVDANNCRDTLYFRTGDCSASNSGMVNESRAGGCDAQITVRTANTFSPYTYRFFRNGNLDRTVQLPDKVLTIGQLCAGSWSVIIEDRFNCLDTTDFNIALGPVSTVLQEQAQAVQLFPNPSQGIFEASAWMEDVMVYNLQGALIWQERRSRRLDLSGQAAGLYLLVFRDENGKMQQLKLQKQ